MNYDDCLELLLDDCVRVDFIAASTCSLPLPWNAPDVVSISGATFGTPLLTLDMEGNGDGDMDAVPTLQIRESDVIGGRTRQHTLQCVVNNGFRNVRNKALSLTNIDVLPLLTYADGSQRTIIPLPNTSNFTLSENTSSGTHTQTAQFVVSSTSPLVEVD